MKNLLITTIAMAGITATASHAATSFTEDFDGNVIGSNFIITDTNSATATVDFTNGNATFPTAADAGRAYLGTTDTDFSTESFTASVDVTIPTTGGANAFFGLGEGTIGGNGGNNAFGEPTGGPTVYLGFTDFTRDNGEVSIGDVNDGAIAGASPIAATNAVVGSGSHTLILDYDSATQLLTFSANINGAATATVLETIDGSDNGFDATNSRIFFGGDDGAVFDNFEVTVIPEPSSTLLLGLAGVLGLARRKR